MIATERSLGYEPVDREFERLGYDIESRDPTTGHLRQRAERAHLRVDIGFGTRFRRGWLHPGACGSRVDRGHRSAARGTQSLLRQSL